MGSREPLCVAGTKLAQETRELVATPTHQLEEEAVRRKAFLVGLVDLVNSEIGLSFATTRWLLGRVESGRFVAAQRNIMPVPIESNLRAGAAGLYFGLVTVYRDGQPAAAVEQLVRAGSGRSLLELMAAARDLSIASSSAE